MPATLMCYACSSTSYCGSSVLVIIAATYLCSICAPNMFPLPAYKVSLLPADRCLHLQRIRCLHLLADRCLYDLRWIRASSAARASY